MKKTYFLLRLLLVIAFTLVLTSCDCNNTNTTNKDNVSKKNMIWEHYYKTNTSFPNIYVCKIQEDNHTFIITETSHGLSMIHDPGCQCLTNLNK